MEGNLTVSVFYNGDPCGKRSSIQPVTIDDRDVPVFGNGSTLAYPRLMALC
jgi:hypothetical protein